MENEIKELKEQLEFLKAYCHEMGIITNWDAHFQDWKKKQGLFRDKRL